MWPIHLDLGFRVFYYYEGLYFLGAISAASWLTFTWFKKAGLDAWGLVGNLPWILLGAIFGARVFHFLFWDPRAFLADPLSFLWIWEGGVSITGGLAGGVLTALLRFRREKVDFWHAFAVASPAVLIGQAIGRVGCFLNGDAWGIPTRLPWGVSQPRFGMFLPMMVRDHRVASGAWLWCLRQGYSSASSLATVPLHPTQLYEALGDLILAGAMVSLGHRLGRTNGPWRSVFWCHLGGYSILRFGLEFLHGDRDATIWAGMTALQLALLAFTLLSAVLLARLWNGPAIQRPEPARH
jgi:phosphatidylglycerol:prolipoprotein diacylglycerol transferase